MRQELELLAPAGTLKTLKAVIHAGADAVYFGGSQFGARAYAGNFNREEVLEAIDYGHIHNSKVIMAVNTLLKEQEMEERLYEYLLPYYEQGLDAVIVQDFGVMQFIRQNFPGLPLHTSTQMTVTSAEGAALLEQCGADRIVMARELSLQEISHIHQTVSAELESFVHGALCYCYSGQCLFSSMLGGRSGNRGRCAQPCRLPYEVYDSSSRKINGREQRYPLSLKDLCTIQEIPKLAESGIYSFKIEGRMKSTEYAAGVVSVYRSCMDRYLNYGAEKYQVSQEDIAKLYDFGSRSGFTRGYYEQKNGADMVTFEKPGHEKHNEKLLEQIRKAYADTSLKEKIQGVLTVKRAQPVTLHLSWREETITVTGSIPQEAQNRPVTRELLLQKLKKTGNTPFVFEMADIVLDEGLFFNMTELNDLRRRGLEQLQQRFLEKYKRTAAKEQKNTVESLPVPLPASAFGEKKICCCASVEQKEQILPVLSHPSITLLYADSVLFSQRKQLVSEWNALYEQTKSAGKTIYYILPAVFRKHTASFYAQVFSELKWDGFLVKSYDALSFLLEHKVPAESIRLDHNMYTWSNRAKEAFASLGIRKDTVPLELNRREILARRNEDSEMLLYGHMPLMTTVQCINKNISGCDKHPKLHRLKDRYGIYFPVKNHCGECYNVIYNSRPLYLFSFFRELEESGIENFRLSFTIENQKQTEKILAVFQQAIDHKEIPEPSDREGFTYGHYKRGVE